MPLLVLLPWEQDPESLSRLSLCPGNGDSIFKDHLLQCILCMSRRVGLYTPPRPWHLEALNWFGRGRSCDGQASKARSATGGSELPSLQWSPEKTLSPGQKSRQELQAPQLGGWPMPVTLVLGKQRQEDQEFGTACWPCLCSTHEHTTSRATYTTHSPQVLKCRPAPAPERLAG